MQLFAYRNTMRNARPILSLVENKPAEIAPEVDRRLALLARAEEERASLIRDILSPLPQRVRRVVQDCCTEDNVDLSMVMQPCRKQRVVRCRDKITYRLRAMTPQPSLTLIARWLRRREHTDVLHSIARHAERTGEPELTKCDYAVRREKVRGQALIAMRKLRANRTTGKDTHE